MKKGPFVAALIAIVFSIPLFTAPLVAQEVQIPVDSQNKLDMISAEVEEELRLFPEVEHFHAARLFNTGDSAYVLEIESKTPSGISRTRKAMNEAEMQRFRAEVTQRIQSTAPSVLLNQEGRARLITGVTVLSAAFYGWAVPALVEADGGGAAGLYFITAGAGYLIPYFATRNSQVTDGMATLGLHGGARGIADGLLIYWLIVDDDDDWDGQGVMGTMLVTSLGELGAGIAIASANDMPGGDASVLATTGFYGLGIGMCAYGMTEPDKASRLGPALGFAGSVLGYIAGSALANNQHYTIGDAGVLATSGALGVALPASILSLADDDIGSEFFGIAIAGSVAGLWIGNELVRGKDFSSSQGQYIQLVTSGAALIGMGIGFSVAQNSDDWQWPFILGSAGATLAFGLMVNGYSSEAASAAEASGHASNWDVHISPLGLASVLGAGSFGDYPVPVAGVTYRW